MTKLYVASLVLLLVSLPGQAQDELFWKHNQYKTDGVKRLMIWQYPVVNNEPGSQPLLYQAEEFDQKGNSTALVLYNIYTSTDYDLHNNWIRKISGSAHTGDAGKINGAGEDTSLRKLEYNASGKIVSEKITGKNTYSYRYNYDKFGNTLKTHVNTDIVNTSKYNRYQKITETKHYKNKKLALHHRYFYDDSLNCIQSISCHLSKPETNFGTCDTTLTYYDAKNRQVKQVQHYFLEGQKKKSVCEYIYNNKNELEEVRYNCWKVQYFYTDKGYLDKTQIFDCSGKLIFYATLNYTFYK